VVGGKQVCPGCELPVKHAVWRSAGGSGGEFFVDNAVRKNGRLEVSRNRTEVCQYFAFFFDTATPESHPALWQILLDKFGPNRAQSGEFPQVHAANAFVGNMLRLELLARHGRVQQLLDESISYLLYMADRTGTLWENTTPTASCNHGFSSHIVHTLYRDVLGLYKIDAVSRTVRIRLSDLRLNWCEGAVPVEGGRISLRWRKDGDRILYRIDAPSGYTVSVENRSGKELVAER
jgi:alpha-L-rhamnosidase